MVLATPALARLEAPNDVRIGQVSRITGVYQSLSDFFAAEFAESDELFAGLHRGEVAFLTSDEAQSKTRLLLQMALGLAGGQAVLPWSPKDNTPRRILYVNGDAAASRLYAELQAMMPHIEDAETALTNFRLLVDMQLHRQPLNLYRDSHWQWFSAFVKQHPADLIIIDGLREPLTPSGRSSAAARLQLLHKARQLSTDHDCAVLVAATSARRKPLTGTALAAIADTLYQLLSDQRRGDDYRQWRCPQSRWVLPEPLDLQRGAEGRGYRLCESEAKAAIGSASRAKAVEVEREREAARMAELLQRFEESALPLLASSVNDVKGLEWLPEERQSNMWQVGNREGQQQKQNAETVANDDDVEKLDTLPATALLAQEGQSSQHRHKRHSKKSWRRR